MPDDATTVYPPDARDARHRTWDFGLTVATVALLGSLGLQSFLGTLYTWWAQRTIFGWEQTSYAGFVSFMNAIAGPQVLALVVVMGLCVPKRLFSQRTLVLVSVAMLAAGAGAGAVRGSVSAGLAFYLALAALIQVAVVVLTVGGARSPSYLTQGRLTKIGSGLLHLGFIIFALVVVSLQRSRLMLPVFTVAAVLTIGGTLLAFYADRLAFRRPAQPPYADEEAADEGVIGEEGVAEAVAEGADTANDAEAPDTPSAPTAL